LELLNAQNNRLVGPIPHGIGYLRNLRSLALYNNAIDGTVPDTLDGMEYLHSLQLHSNRLSGTLPPALGHMPRLKGMSAYRNMLSGSLPITVGRLSDLGHLLLSHNHLRGPLPTELGDLRAIEILDISRNNLTHPIPSEIGKISTLQHLILSDNGPGLSSQIPSSLSQLTGLLTLDLKNNALNGVLPDFLKTPYQQGRDVGITGNPYYCPLELWAIGVSADTSNGSSISSSSAIEGYPGIHCLHCPGELGQAAYTLPDGRPDYTKTCNGHGVCIDGLRCECEPAWRHPDQTDCSLLACPLEESVMSDGSTLTAYCSGVGNCVNVVASFNATVSCDVVTPYDTAVGNDHVAFSVDCSTRTMTIAQCECPQGTSVPRCQPISVAAATITVLGAASREDRSLIPTILAVTVGAVLVFRQQDRRAYTHSRWR